MINQRNRNNQAQSQRTLQQSSHVSGQSHRQNQNNNTPSIKNVSSFGSNFQTQRQHCGRSEMKQQLTIEGVVAQTQVYPHSQSIQNSISHNKRVGSVNKARYENTSKQREAFNNIQVFQFTIEDEKRMEQTNIQNNNKILANITRIIDCKNQTATLLTQIETYIEMINKLQKENKDYRNKLENKEKENRVLKDAVHIRDMEIVELKEENQRIKRLYSVQRAKYNAIKESYTEAQRERLQIMIKQAEESNKNNDVYSEHYTLENSNINHSNQFKRSFNSYHRDRSRQCITHTNIKSNLKIQNKSQSPYYRVSCQNSFESPNPEYHRTNLSLPEANEKQTINISKILEESDSKLEGKILRRTSNKFGHIKHKVPQEQSTII